MNEYFLMNKDVKLIRFSIESTALGENIVEIKHFDNDLPVGFTNMSAWLASRNYAKHKKHFTEWLSTWGIDTIKGFIDITHGLSINDCLWIKPVDSSLTWDKVNLYTNSFSDVAKYTAFDSGLHGLNLSSTHLTSPEFTLEGAAPKCWEKENDTIYLYKSCLSGAANFGLEANSEYIASNIASQIFTNVVDYDVVLFADKLCSKCALFTDEKTGFVPFYKFIKVEQAYNINDVLKICTELGFERECKEMFLLDSIIFNQDRHLGNFGFLVDNETFQVKEFAPFFDFNISMLCNAMDMDIKSIQAFKDYEQTYLLGHKLGGRFADVGRALWSNETKKGIPKLIDFPIHSKYNLDSNRISMLLDIMNNNLSEISQTKLFAVNIPQKEIIKTDREIAVLTSFDIKRDNRQL